MLFLALCLLAWVLISQARRLAPPKKSTLLITAGLGAALGFGSVVPQMLLRTGKSAGPLAPLALEGAVRAAALACIAAPLLCFAAGRLCALCEKAAAPARPFPRLAFFAASLLVLYPAWKNRLVENGTLDYANQLGQVQGTVPLNDVHTLAHTFIIWLFRGNHSALVTGQFLALAALTCLFAAWLWRRGLPPFAVSAGLLAFMLNSTTLAMFQIGTKDPPYGLCMGLALYFMARFIANDLAWRWYHRLAFGVTLAGCGLLRYNGYAFVLVCLVWLAVMGFVRRRREGFSVVAAALATVLVFNFCAYNIAGAVKMPSGVSMQVPATGIVILLHDGVLTPEQEARARELMAVDCAVKAIDEFDIDHYNSTKRIWWHRDLLTYVPTASEEKFAPLLDQDIYLIDPLNNLFTLSLAENKAGIVALYLELFFQHPIACLRLIAENQTSAWGWSTENPMSHLFYLCLMLMGFAALGLRRLARTWPLMLPVLCNLGSVLIASATNEDRYLLPTYLLAVPSILFAVAAANDRCAAREKTIQAGSV
ncbi:hypothetical protein [Candidatus Allofournierella excrementigallinarum]|uniref:hypothetical protein n=1 Tax=Candidatus Allofournierella excrementigallinarum TaxID=2838592 RepID=UPI00374EC29F